MRGEVSFEYLVILALFAVLATLIVSLSISFMNISSGTGEWIETVTKGIERVIA